MNDTFKKDTVNGLKCITGENRTEYMRNFVKYGFDKCENCVIHYNKRKSESCVRLVCEYALDLLSDLQVEKDEELIHALKCLACKNHKEQASHYFKFRDEECTVCKYRGEYKRGNVWGPRYCHKETCADALKLIEEKLKGGDRK